MQKLRLGIGQTVFITLVSTIVLAIAITNARAAVTLVSFTATINGAQAKIEWETASELDLSGFYVLRSLFSDVGYVRIEGFIPGTPNPVEFIPGEGNSIVGETYEFIDSNITLGINYYYKLEDIDINTYSDFHGPVVIGPATPTPTTTNTPTSTPTTGTPTPSGTPTKTAWPTTTPTFNPSASPSITPTSTITFTPTITPTPAPPEADISFPGQFFFHTPTPSPTSTPTPTQPPPSSPLTSFLPEAGIIAGIILFWIVLGIVYFKYLSPKK